MSLLRWIAAPLAIATQLAATAPLGSQEPSRPPLTVEAIPTGKYDFIFKILADDEDERQGLPYYEIRLKNWGHKPHFADEVVRDYSVVFRRDGTAVYRGESGVKMLGRWDGEIDIYSLGQLSYLLEQVGAGEPDAAFGRQVAVSNSIRAEISVRLNPDGSDFVYKSDRGLGDLRFDIIADVIDGIASRIEWTRYDKLNRKVD